MLAQEQAAAWDAHLRLAIPPGGAVRRGLELTRLEHALLIYPNVGAAAATA